MPNRPQNTVGSLQERIRRIVDGSDLLAQRSGHEADLRVVPTTARGRRTVEGILDAARALITLGDVRELTTIAIAAYANINVATPYRYFRDVDSILREITLRREIEAAEALAGGMEGLASAADWHAYCDDVITGMARYWEEGIDRGTIVHGLRSVGGTWPIIRAGHELNAELVACALNQRDPARGEDAWLVIVRPLIVAVREGLNYAYRADPPDEAHVRQLQVLARAYLGVYLDG